jgi:hypothetical protein
MLNICANQISKMLIGSRFRQLLFVVDASSSTLFLIRFLLAARVPVSKLPPENCLASRFRVNVKGCEARLMDQNLLVSLRGNLIRITYIFLTSLRRAPDSTATTQLIRSRNFFIDNIDAIRQPGVCKCRSSKFEPSVYEISLRWSVRWTR